MRRYVVQSFLKFYHFLRRGNSPKLLSNSAKYSELFIDRKMSMLVSANSLATCMYSVIIDIDVFADCGKYLATCQECRLEELRLLFKRKIHTMIPMYIVLFYSSS